MPSCIANERVESQQDGLVRLSRRRAFADGTVAVDMDPLSLVCRLAASVPPPRFHAVKYAGVPASASLAAIRLDLPMRLPWGRLGPEPGAWRARPHGGSQVPTLAHHFHPVADRVGARPLRLPHPSRRAASSQMPAPRTRRTIPVPITAAPA
ncbi:transposase [Sorangium sp. So ce233]|uniref:transposase n=1 Tax=Sorangium sp. So ce233 TaxID=3133290 RepID=UPI003F617000